MTEEVIDFNKHFQPRPYQLDLYRAFFVENKKRLVRVMHRRAGKDTEAFGLCWLAALTRPGLYLYLLPKIAQARSVIFEGRGKDGVGLIGRIPRKIIAGINKTMMKITLVNGSIIHISGSDNFEALLGTNPLGAVMSEFQNMNPLAWELFLRPVLAENGGWALMNGTPRGHNALYDLVEQNKNNSEWFVSVKTVDDTKLENGLPAVPLEMVEAERAAGMPENLVQQEFYCSFESAIVGAYFGEHMKKMKEESRIKLFDVNPKAKVYTGWDIGVRDPSSIWLMQNVNGVFRMIYHLEQPDKDLDFFIMRLKELQRQLKFESYGKHFVPHDIAVREWGTGKSRLSQAREKGIILTPVNNIGGKQIRIMEGISIVRHNMSKMEINSVNCKQGIRSLQEYHALYSENKKDYLGPNHNWASHACSAMATLFVGYMIQYDNNELLKVRNYASYEPCV